MPLAWIASTQPAVGFPAAGGLLHQRGLAWIDPAAGTTGEIADGDAGLPENFVTSVLPMPIGPPFVGTYGKGLARLDLPKSSAAGLAVIARERATPPALAPLPSPAAPPERGGTRGTFGFLHWKARPQSRIQGGQSLTGRLED